MTSIIGLLVALIVAMVVLWLLDLAIPTALAALIALAVFLWLVFGGGYERMGRGRGFGGGRVRTGDRF
jgi:hypothetical protein